MFTNDNTVPAAVASDANIVASPKTDLRSIARLVTSYVNALVKSDKAGATVQDAVRAAYAAKDYASLKVGMLTLYSHTAADPVELAKHARRLFKQPIEDASKGRYTIGRDGEVKAVKPRAEGGSKRHAEKPSPEQAALDYVQAHKLDAGFRAKLLAVLA